MGWFYWSHTAAERLCGGINIRTNLDPCWFSPAEIFFGPMKSFELMSLPRQNGSDIMEVAIWCHNIQFCLTNTTTRTWTISQDNIWLQITRKMNYKEVVTNIRSLTLALA